jgi:hypothetical protein
VWTKCETKPICHIWLHAGATPEQAVGGGRGARPGISGCPPVGVCCMVGSSRFDRWGQRCAHDEDARQQRRA